MAKKNEAWQQRRDAYRQKLRSPHWQKKRLEILERDGWTCKACGDKETMLAVHHRYYMPDSDPWDYPNDALVTLCDPCHTEETENRKDAEERLLTALRVNGFTWVDVLLLSSLFGFPWDDFLDDAEDDTPKIVYQIRCQVMAFLKWFRPMYQQMDNSDE